jgi:ATP-dependent Zn protease
MRRYGQNFAIVFLVLILIIFVSSVTTITKNDEPVAYSNFKSIVREGKTDQISKVIVTNGDSVFQVQFTGNSRLRSVVVPVESKESLINDLEKAGVLIEVHEPDKSPFWFSMISSFFLPILLLVGFLSIFRSAQSGGNRH